VLGFGREGIAEEILKIPAQFASQIAVGKKGTGTAGSQCWAVMGLFARSQSPDLKMRLALTRTVLGSWSAQPPLPKVSWRPPGKVKPYNTLGRVELRFRRSALIMEVW
jgi:hypothetical protein